MSLEIDNGPYSIYDHSRPGHICISRQTDQGLRCLLIERLKPIYYKKKKKKQTKKLVIWTLIRRRDCSRWSSLVAYVIWSLSIWRGSFCGQCQARRCRRTCAKCTDSDSSRTCAKSHPGICSPLIYSIVSYDSVSGQRRPRSDCADAQSDLGLRCPHMPKTHFRMARPM